MPRYKPTERDGLLLPVILAEQIQPGSFEFALDHLVEHELELSDLDARFDNDETGASAYDPRVMLRIVLLAYSRGLVSSRRIAHACEYNIQFIALSGDARPSYSHIAKFVRELGPQIGELFTQVLITCDRTHLIGRHMFAIDGVKLPANASKERSGTHDELRHRAARLDKAARKIIELHQSQDASGAQGELDAGRQARIEALRREAKRTREFVATSAKRRGRKGKELKSNITDPDSAKMATSKGVIQGYAAQAAVDSEHQIIVAADVIGSGSEQAMLMPMVQRCEPYRANHTMIKADAGYHSEDNIAALKEQAIPAMVADNQMRQRDERLEGQAKHKAKKDPLYDKQPTGKHKPIRLFKPGDFRFIGYAHHLLLKVSDAGVAETRAYLQSFLAGRSEAGFFECDGEEAGAAFLHRFAVGNATNRYRAVHADSVEDVVALDIALPRNALDWFEALPPALAAQIEQTMYCGHFFCHVSTRSTW